MKRQIENDLIKWKKNPHKKPLIIKGSRQVGKTFCIREFAKSQYHDFIEINFERNLKMVDLFNKTREPNELLEYLKITYMDSVFDENTLLFLDEVQACPSALTTLKFMSESFPCGIICSGSLLGIAIASTSSFPVGYVETWTLYPMSFLEFLDAYGLPDDIMKKINQSLDNLKKIPEIIHEKMNELFTTYMMTGGMPEVVSTYIETKSYRECLTIQRRIVNDYISDMAKYAHASDKIKAKECFLSIPIQLAKENKKFQYGVVKKGYNARYYDSSLQWLQDNGMIIKVNRLSHISTPLASAVELPIFKVYMADVGLFISQLEDGEIQKIISGDLGIFKGALYENMAAQIFQRKHKKCYYFEPSQTTEIDFIIEYEGEITPIDIKAGLNTASKSFKNFVEKYKPIHAFRFSQKNIGIAKEGNIVYLPLYLLEILLEHEVPISFDLPINNEKS